LVTGPVTHRLPNILYSPFTTHQTSGATKKSLTRVRRARVGAAMSACSAKTTWYELFS